MSFFLKKCIYEEKCETVTKRKSAVKTVITNQISLEHLTKGYYTTAFFETLVLVFHFALMLRRKMLTSFKTLGSKKAKTWWLEKMSG